jgi:hypothetical protein
MNRSYSAGAACASSERRNGADAALTHVVLLGSEALEYLQQHISVRFGQRDSEVDLRKVVSHGGRSQVVGTLIGRGNG